MMFLGCGCDFGLAHISSTWSLPVLGAVTCLQSFGHCQTPSSFHALLLELRVCYCDSICPGHRSRMFRMVRDRMEKGSLRRASTSDGRPIIFSALNLSRC